jgi:ubiquitin C-terminal hydrolase
MTGQYRSIVTCPDCTHKSTTFDPFITVTLPIPENI